MNRKIELDKEGFFVIIVDQDKKKIVVEHYKNVEKGRMVGTGKLNKIFEGTDAEEMCHIIINTGLISRLEHATYLGRELQKAEIALRSNLHYEQDK
jgi:tetrahydromethanopterin S-methyltransferase subunit A